MDISSWEAAGIADKVLIYALSLLSAGGAIFTFVFHCDLTNDDAEGKLAQPAHLPIIAGTLGGDFASMRVASLLLYAFESEGMAMGLQLAGCE